MQNMQYTVLNTLLVRYFIISKLCIHWIVSTFFFFLSYALLILCLLYTHIHQRRQHIMLVLESSVYHMVVEAHIYISLGDSCM